MTTRTLCGTKGTRTQHVYISEANRVEVRIVSKNDPEDTDEDRVYFLLQYQGI